MNRRLTKTYSAGSLIKFISEKDKIIIMDKTVPLSPHEKMLFVPGKFRVIVRRLISMLQVDQTDTKVDAFLHAFIVYYKKYATARQLLDLIKLELGSKTNLIGCMKVLFVWCETRFSLDFRGRLLNQVIEIIFAYGKRSNGRGDDLVSEYTNRVKLIIIRETQKKSRGNRLTISPLVPPKQRSIKFFEYAPPDVAKQMTLFEFSVFASIRSEEFYGKEHNNPKKAPNLSYLVSRSNDVTSWAATCILHQKNMEHRIRACNRFVLIAYFCKEMGNFNTAMELLNVFQIRVVSRLRKLLFPAGGEKKYHALLREMEILFKPEGNYSLYRKILAERLADAKKPTLPYIGLYLKDMTFIDDGNPDYDGDDKSKKVNMQKMSMIGAQLHSIHTLQKRAYSQKDLTRLPSLLEHLIALPHLSDEEQERLSEAIRPVATNIKEEQATPENLSTEDLLKDLPNATDFTPSSSDGNSDLSDIMEFTSSDIHSPRILDILQKYVPL